MLALGTRVTVAEAVVPPESSAPLGVCVGGGASLVSPRAGVDVLADPMSEVRHLRNTFPPFHFHLLTTLLLLFYGISQNSGV